METRKQEDVERIVAGMFGADALAMLDDEPSGLSSDLVHQQELQTARLMLVKVAGYLIGVQINHVIEVKHRPRITHLPGCQPWLAGATLSRGEILSVIDLGVYMTKADHAYERGRSVLVLSNSASDKQAGVLLDELIGLHDVALLPEADAQLVVDVPEGLPLTGKALHHDDVVLIIDVNRWMSSERFLNVAR